MRESDDLGERIEAKLGLLVKMVALGITDGLPGLGSKACLLRRLGMQPKEIADLFGTTANTVRVSVAIAKRSLRTTGKSRKGKK